MMPFGRGKQPERQADALRNLQRKNIEALPPSSAAFVPTRLRKFFR